MSRSMAMMYGGPPTRKPHAFDCKCPRCSFARANENETFEAAPMHPCSKCNRHIRVGEVCPWCHAEALKPKECQTCKRKDAALAVAETVRANLVRNMKQTTLEWQKWAKRARDAEAALRVRKRKGKSSERS